MSLFDRLRSEENQRDQRRLKHGAREDARIDDQRICDLVCTESREETRDASHVRIEIASEEASQVDFFEFDRGQMCRKEHDAKQCGERQRFEAQPRADEREETEEVKRVSRKRIGAAIDECLVLTASDVERTLNAASTSGDQKRVTD